MSLRDKMRKLKKTLGDLILGATVYEMIRDLQEKRRCARNMFMLACFGDMLGYPISSYYRLRLLPFWAPGLRGWKRNLLKEKDVTEKLR